MSNELTRLHQFITEKFNLDELDELCFDLGVNTGELGRSGLSVKVRELLILIGRTRRYDALLKELALKRSDSFDIFGLRVDTAYQEILYAALPFFGDVYISIEQLSRLENLPPIEGSPPYKGLSYFTLEDEALFFGRNTLKQMLIEQIAGRPFIAVVGASGSGKSSVVRAGALPELIRQGWSVLIITPTAHPLTELSRAFYPHDELAQRNFCQSLSQNIQALHQYSLSLANQTLLVIDQFEELFTHSDGGEQEQYEQQVFVESLLYAVEADNKLTVLIILRSDFYDRCSSFAELFPLVAKHQLPVEAMKREALKDAIMEPARQNGWLIQEGLDKLILDDLGDEPGSLPFLSHVLRETWERRRANVLTLSGYRDAGGVKGAIETTAEEVWASFNRNPAKQAIMRDIFMSLTELGEVDSIGVHIPDTRRRMLRSALRSESIVEPIFDDVINTLVRRRLVRIDTDYVEVAHEIIIRAWSRLQKWLETEREFLKWHRRFAEIVIKWEKDNENSGHLQQGILLDETLRKFREHESEFTSTERVFVSRSIKRSRTRRQLITIAILALLTLAFIATVAALTLAQRNRDLRAQSLQAISAFSTINIPYSNRSAGDLRSEQLLFQKLYTLERTNSDYVNVLARLDDVLGMLNSRDNLFWTFSQDAKWIAYGDSARNVYLWDWQTEDVPIVIGVRRNGQNIWWLAFSANADLFASPGGAPGSVEVWDLNDLEAPRFILEGLKYGIAQIQSIAVSPDGRWVVGGGVGQVAVIWDLEDEDDVQNPQLLLDAEDGDGSQIITIQFSTSGQWLGLRNEDGQLFLWQFKEGAWNLLTSPSK